MNNFDNLSKKNNSIEHDVAKRIWDIAKISPEHGNALMDLLGNELYTKISLMQNNNESV